MYVAIEGIDTCGKSTQIELLKKQFKDAIFVKEPGSTPLGEKLRELLLNFEIRSHRAEFLLFCADRAELMESVVEQNEDKLIISDRSVISGIAYADKYDMETTLFINNFALGGIFPQKAIMLELDRDTLLSRMSKKCEDRIEQRGTEKLLQYQARIKEVIQSLKIESMIVDAKLPIEEINRQISKFLAQ